ncbi:uncharacterized protein FA14DRAFT_177472 [Meira miltonrushii]|uniref:Uncharacterized protein n=1 Tax=Meira miltonrushii TaxID=1280837 RepID=A0A316VM86_9BASI|nr:uncharacterized protein FA14DRAFT_177472 [Meira miltonrushii]PWN38198.1 hypothetical protein FA14DRAFT_177472 [Meira miltonrushii]
MILHMIIQLVRLFIASLLFLVLLTSAASSSTDTNVQKDPRMPHTDLHGLSKIGRGVEEEIQKNLGNSERSRKWIPEEIPLRRKVSMEGISMFEEIKRNHRHKQENQYTQKMNVHGRDPASKMSKVRTYWHNTMDAKRERAIKKKEKHIQVLNKVGRDAALYREHGLLSSEDQHEIVGIKTDDSHKLGYKCPMPGCQNS